MEHVLASKKAQCGTQSSVLFKFKLVYQKFPNFRASWSSATSLIHQSVAKLFGLLVCSKLTTCTICLRSESLTERTERSAVHGVGLTFPTRMRLFRGEIRCKGIRNHHRGSLTQDVSGDLPNWVYKKQSPVRDIPPSSVLPTLLGTIS